MDEQSIREAPQRRILQGLLTRIDDADRKLNSPGQQGPQGRKPQSLCVTWGPIGMQTPRRYGTEGYGALAPLVSPGTYLTPNYPTQVNPFVATPGPFYWCSTGVYADLCWTYTNIPYNPEDTPTVTTDDPLDSTSTTINVVSTTGFPSSGVIIIGTEEISYTATTGTSFTGCVRGVNGTSAASHAVDSSVTALSDPSWPVAGVPQGGLFDPAIQNNGGGIILNNFAGNQQFSSAIIHPKVCAEIDIYDKTRGRSLTSGRVPLETFTGGAYGFKKLPEPLRFERGSQIEPRLYVTQVQMSEIMEEGFGGTPVYLAADVRVYVSMVFKGYNVNARNLAGFPSYDVVGGP